MRTVVSTHDWIRHLSDARPRFLDMNNIFQRIQFNGITETSKSYLRLALDSSPLIGLLPGPARLTGAVSGNSFVDLAVLINPRLLDYSIC